MLTSAECQKKYGPPAIDNKWLTLWDVPSSLEIGVIPKRLYCNKDMISPLEKAFTYLIGTGFVKDLKTFDGCFNIRKKRGAKSMSLHSWGVAIDFNAFENQLYHQPKMSPGVVKCFKDAGFDWGGDWPEKLDGMHFQLSNI